MKNKFRINFVGAFSGQCESNAATSAAGDQVQFEITTALIRLGSEHCATLDAISLYPIRTFPFGRLLWRGLRDGYIYMPPFLNIAGVKRFVFSLYLFGFLIRKKPHLVVKYNISIFEAVSLLFYRLLRSEVYLVAIVQDVHIQKNNNLLIKTMQYFELISLRLVSRFDMLIPISKKIANDFLFHENKTRVFNGGLTRQGRRLLADCGRNIEPYAVFAGALTPYNGIELLIKRWIIDEIDFKLHIFGKGVSEEFVINESVKSKNIIFHGFKSEEEVGDWQKKALINFCLRYSDGIDAGYFFPSKLFNVICAPGLVMANNFEGFPSDLQKYCIMLNDDLSDLSDKINEAKTFSKLSELRELRRVWIMHNGDWNTIVSDIFERTKSRRLA